MRGSSRGLRQSSHDGAAREIDLEGVVRETLGVTQQQVRRVPEGRVICRLTAQRSFGRRIAPRLVRDATERQTRIFRYE